SGRVARKAGTRPNATLLSNDSDIAKTITRQSRERLSAVLAKILPLERANTQGKSSSTLHRTSRIPVAPPAAASRKLSVNNKRITRQRLAPTANRTPISEARPAPRANSLLAVFETAIRSH